MTRLQDVFLSYSTNAAYIAARDSVIKQFENGALANGNANAGMYNFGTRYTIGYGFDLSQQSGKTIKTAMQGAGITLSAQQIKDLDSADLKTVPHATIDADFKNFIITEAQATDLLHWSITNTYDPRLTGVVQSVAGNTDSQAFAEGDTSLHILLLSDVYNGIFKANGNLAKAVANDDPGLLIADQLFNNYKFLHPNEVTSRYDDGLENRRIADLNAAMGLGTSATGVTPTTEAQALALLDAVVGHADQISQFIAGAGDGQARLQALESSLAASANQVAASFGSAYVAPGDTFATLAARSAASGVSAADVALLNGMSASAALIAGVTLLLPTAVSASLPTTLSSSNQYVYDIATGRTLITPNPEGFGGVTLINSASGNAYVGQIDLTEAAGLTPNTDGSLTIGLSGGRSITVSHSGAIQTNDGQGVTQSYDAGASVSVSFDGNTEVKATAAGSWSQLFAPATDPVSTPIGSTLPTSDVGSAAYLAQFLASTGSAIDGSQLTQIGATAQVTDDNGNPFLSSSYSGVIGGEKISVTINAPLTEGVQGTVEVTRESFGIALTETYLANADGSFAPAVYGFLGTNGDFDNPNGSFAGAATAVATLEQSLDVAVGLDTAGTTLDETRLSDTVVNLGDVPLGNLPLTSDPSGAVSQNMVVSGPDVTVTVPGINLDGLLSSTAGGIVSGNNRPGNQQLEPDAANTTLRLTDENDAYMSDLGLNPGYFLGDFTTDSSTFVNIDPLVFDLSGNGIDLSNWISNNIYFQSNVVFDATTGKATSDAMAHHTGWVNADNGILVLPTALGQVPDITNTISEYFRGGQLNAATGTYTPWADGLAALASLAQSGATSFSAATSLIDPGTGQSYFNELMIWQDANQDGTAQAGELHSLASLGIASVSLSGTGNLGQTIAGNSVTNQTNYTTSSGTIGEVASVNLQTDTTGDVTTTANGGVVITSTPEGGVSATNSFVVQNSTGHTYTVSGGTLTDTTGGTSTLVKTGITGIFSTTQNDSITVSATDTGTYWLGGGTGADTLTGGAGTNVFLMNAKTIVHGGSGFNIAYVTDALAANIDLSTDHLQEVIGGSGGGVFNASGTSWNVFIQATAGNNILIGGAAVDALSGGTGDDLIEGGPGGSVIHAGSGNDLIYGGSGATAVTQPSYVNAGASSNAAFVERLYEAGLGQEADLSGFQSWVEALSSGALTQTQVTADFLSGAAWQAHYGTQTDTQFVTSMFQNFVGRAPSSSELTQFTQALAAGQTRAVALQTIASSSQSESYWGGKHPGASDVIYGGPGHDVVTLGTNNTIVYAGTGAMTLIGNANGFSVLSLHGSYADYTLTSNADGTFTIKDSVAGRDGTVTFQNISALDFSDIAQVPLASALGMPVSDQLTIGSSQVTTSGNSYVIAAATLLGNDLDYSGKTLSIRELVDNNGNPIAFGSSGQVNGGTAALSADGTTITFTPTAGFSGVYSFRYHVKDSSGQDGMVVNQIGTTSTAEMTATVYLNQPSQPTDPLFDKEWFLQAADVIPVWSDYTGAGVTVGVFDPSGNVDFSNSDLAPNAGQSVRIDGTPGVDQLGTHATLVAGVIGAANDGTGAVGVAYGATIASEALGIGTDANLTNIFDWKNYDVVNNSWGNSALFFDNANTTPAFGQAFQQAAAQGRDGLGTVVIFAGGNNRAGGDNTNYHNESNSRYAITVGGINAPSDLGSLQISGAPFSNPGASILVSAPANQITSTSVAYTNQFGQQFGADYATAQGTSFATPIVAGVVALMLQANPTLGYRDIQKILAYSAIEVDPTGSNWTSNGATNWNGGGLHTSEDYGFGEVDALAAVRLAETWQWQSTTANEAVDSTVRGQTSTTPGATALNIAIPSAQGITAAQEQTFVIPNDSQHALSVEHASVELNLEGVDPNNLIVTLISPSGVVSTLVNQPPASLNGTGVTNPQNVDFTFDSVRDYGESAAGTWTVEVAYAPGTTPQGTIGGISFNLYGSAPDGSQTFIYTDEFTSLGIGTRATIQDVSSASDTINVAATTGAARLDLVAGSTDSTIDGRAVTIGSTTHIDTAFLGDGGGTLIGNNDGDVLVAGRGAATIIGGNASDEIYGGGTNGIGSPTTHDVLSGGAGNDIFYLGTASAAVNGGSGTNTIDFMYAKSGVAVNLVTGTGGDAAAGDTFAGIQSLVGSAYDDTVTAWGGVTLDGGAGSNTLDYSSASSPVTVDFNEGAAEVGSLAVDTISDFQNVIGSAGDDYFIDGAGLGSVDGGAGSNTLDLSEDLGPVSINLVAGTGTNGYGDTLSLTNIQIVYGSSFYANTIVGASDTEAILGSVFGGDTITANSASTAVTFQQSDSGVIVNLATGVNIGGAAQGDVLNNVQTIVGSADSDSITGNSGNNVFDGYFGNDTLVGDGGDDTYFFATFAGYGRDTIVNGVASNNNASGELDLGTSGANDVLASNVWLRRVGNDLQVDVIGTTSSMTLKGWFTNAYSQLNRIVASDGSTITTQAIGQLQQAMATYQSANPGFNPQTAGQTMPAALASQIAADWTPPVGSGAMALSANAALAGASSGAAPTNLANAHAADRNPLVAISGDGHMMPASFAAIAHAGSASALGAGAQWSAADAQALFNLTQAMASHSDPGGAGLIQPVPSTYTDQPIWASSSLRHAA
jgi:subtilisin-like proprotein convertase family protein